MSYSYQTQRETVIFKNVIISNLISGNSDSGIIHINSFFNVILDNVTIINNKDFASVLMCTTGSQCNVKIRHSTFEGNDGICTDGEWVINGIYLEETAYASVTIENSTFIGIPWIHSRSCCC